MARVKSHFKCMLCNQVLHFPKDIGIVDFMVLILQFYKNHEICEQSEIERLKASENVVEPQPSVSET